MTDSKKSVLSPQILIFGKFVMELVQIHICLTDSFYMYEKIFAHFLIY
jgi:hypothetical protein